MNKNLLMTAVALLLLTSCGRQSTYEKAIADFVQTDKNGTWTDLQFKVIEMGEPTNITVGDSVAILTEEFEAKKSKELDFYNQRISEYKGLIDFYNQRISGSFSMGQALIYETAKQSYQKLINKDRVVVDSLAKTSVELPEAYKSASETTVLAKKITCKFSIINPRVGNAKQEITEIFVLNAEGDKCFRRNSKK